MLEESSSDDDTDDLDATTATATQLAAYLRARGQYVSAADARDRMMLRLKVEVGLNVHSVRLDQWQTNSHSGWHTKLSVNQHALSCQ